MGSINIKKIDMNRIGRIVSSLKGSGKRKLVKYVLLFFTFMVAFTILSRITYNCMIPEVSLYQAEQAVVRHSLTTQGTVGALEEIPVFTEAELLIESIRVKEGQNVSEGDVLYTIERDSLDKKIADFKDDVSALQAQIASMKSNDADQADIRQVRAEYDKANRKLNRYIDIRNKGYAVKAGCNGTITKIKIEAGELTSGAADMLMAEEKSGFGVVARIEPEGEGAYVTSETEAQISFPGNKETVASKVTSVTIDNESGMIFVFIKLPEGEYVLGQAVSIELISSSEKYDVCIPVTALHGDNRSYFVYGIIAEETILGEELTVTRFDVELIDRNMEYAAIEGISRGQKVIDSSDKVIGVDDKVKVMK